MFLLQKNSTLLFVTLNFVVRLFTLLDYFVSFEKFHPIKFSTITNLAKNLIHEVWNILKHVFYTITVRKYIIMKKYKCVLIYLKRKGAQDFLAFAQNTLPGHL